MQVNTVIDAVIIKETQWSKFKYIHLRYHDESGNIVNLGGVTIAYQVDAQSIRYGIAVCSQEDNFEKATGRRIATERICTGGGTEVYLPDGREPRDLIEDLVVPIAFELVRDLRRIRSSRKRKAGLESVSPVLIDSLY